MVVKYYKGPEYIATISIAMSYKIYPNFRDFWSEKKPSGSPATTHQPLNEVATLRAYTCGADHAIQAAQKRNESNRNLISNSVGLSGKVIATG
jgi:hypothetical protein